MSYTIYKYNITWGAPKVKKKNKKQIYTDFPMLVTTLLWFLFTLVRVSVGMCVYVWVAGRQ